MTLFYLCIFLIIILLVYISRFFILKCDNTFTFISGELKGGKTLLSIKCALTELKIARFKYYFKKYIYFLLLSKKEIEKPVLISNIPLRCNYVPFTEDVLMRNVRIPHKSITLLDECTLIADSMLYKDKNINSNLMLYVKLYGHSVHGGRLILNSQSLSDLHYNGKRCIGHYWQITKKINLPFFVLIRFQERLCICGEDNNINVLEDSERLKIVSKKLFKTYDCYCYSVFTDNLPLYNFEINGKKLHDLKQRNLVTFQDFNGQLMKGSENNG